MARVTSGSLRWRWRRASAAASNTLWAGTQQHGVWRSADGGAIWAAVNTGLTNQAVRSLTVAADGTLFAGTTAGGIFRSTDGGGSWAKVGAGVTESDIISLAASPNYATDGTIFAGTGGGILSSTDRGLTWTQRADFDNSVNDIVVLPSTPLTLFAAGDDRLAKSSDGGMNWTNLNVASSPGSFAAVAASPNYAVDQTLFAGTRWNECGKLYKSTNGGLTWGQVNHGGWCEIRDIALSPAYPTDPTIFVGADWNGLYQTTNDGNEWTRPLEQNRFEAVAVSPAFTTDQIVFAAGVGEGIFKSADGGAAWAPLVDLTQPGNYQHGVHIAHRAHDNIVGGAATGAGNLISNNGGDGVSIENADLNFVYGNRVGTDASGMATMGNTGMGIRVESSGQYNQIGGSAAGQGNLISGNLDAGVFLGHAGTMYNVIAGNRIGTDASGNAALGNGNGGVSSWESPANNLIGGVNATPNGICSGACNLISGNAGLAGVALHGVGAQDNIISGNYIGTNISGTLPLPNRRGVELGNGASKNMIGGSTPGERNLVSGNRTVGVFIHDKETTQNTVLGNFIGVTADGQASLGTNAIGVSISRSGDNVIGGANATPGGACTGACNVISGNGRGGVWLSGTGAERNQVRGNYIGPDVTGQGMLGNGVDQPGVLITQDAVRNRIGGAAAGEENVIAFNAAAA